MIFPLRLLIFLFVSPSTGLRVTSLRRRGVTSSTFSSKSSAPCFQATLAKWTKLLCWKKSLAFCRNTMVRFTAALHALARQWLQYPISLSDYQNDSRGLKVPTLGIFFFSHQKRSFAGTVLPKSISLAALQLKMTLSLLEKEVNGRNQGKEGSSALQHRWRREMLWTREIWGQRGDSVPWNLQYSEQRTEHAPQLFCRNMQGNNLFSPPAPQWTV